MVLNPGIGILTEPRAGRGAIAEDPNISECELRFECPLNLNGGCAIYSNALCFPQPTVIDKNVPLACFLPYNNSHLRCLSELVDDFVRDVVYVD